MTESSNRNLLLTDAAALRGARVAAVLLVAGLVALLGWMVVTPVDEIAKARGEVQPVAQVRRVEALYGGRLMDVPVVLGQTVSEGDVLVTFDRTEAEAQLDVVMSERAALDLQILRLNAFIDETAADFSAFAGDFPDLVALEQAALAAQRAFVASEVAVIENQISESREELRAVTQELPELDEQLRLVEEERDVQESLLERGLANRDRLATLREEAARIRFEQARLAGRSAVLTARIDEQQEAINRVAFEERAKASQALVTARADRLAKGAETEGLKRRLEETEILAPLAGIVQDLPDANSGDVMEPGDLVASVVPITGGLRFRGALSPRDIAFVQVGQPVRLKFDSFDFSRYGALSGRVEELSPTTHVDERGNAFYRVDITLDQTFFEAPDARLALLPGMSAEADIRTGQKTVFEYVWKPIYTNLDLALTER